jgi:hypothetical protein
MVPGKWARTQISSELGFRRCCAPPRPWPFEVRLRCGRLRRHGLAFGCVPSTTFCTSSLPGRRLVRSAASNQYKPLPRWQRHVEDTLDAGLSMRCGGGALALRCWRSAADSIEIGPRRTPRTGACGDAWTGTAINYEITTPATSAASCQEASALRRSSFCRRLPGPVRWCPG